MSSAGGISFVVLRTQPAPCGQQPVHLICTSNICFCGQTRAQGPSLSGNLRTTPDVCWCIFSFLFKDQSFKHRIIFSCPLLETRYSSICFWFRRRQCCTKRRRSGSQSRIQALALQGNILGPVTTNNEKPQPNSAAALCWCNGVSPWESVS